ncbi:MAG: glycosyltransferase family 4 protein [Thermoleophilia bacterium]
MPDGAVAYVLKGYPRISELFIASEIHRLETLGVPLRLYVLKPADEDVRHPVVDRIAARPEYLPATTSLSRSRLLPWLRRNLPAFLPSLGRVARRHPVGLARACGRALAQSVRARSGWRPKRIYVKELLQAVALADRIGVAGDVRHLHAHFAHGTTTVTWLAAGILGLPYSFTGHAKDIYRGSLNPAGLLERKMRGAEFVVTCTGANAAHLEALGTGVPVHLVYHGLNADFTGLLDEPCPDCPAPPRPRIVSVGRRVPKKGFDVLVDALALLRDRGVDAELVIAGEPGDQDAELTRRIDALGLADRVELRGTVTQRELLDLYRHASVFALACRVVGDGDRDGIPNVLVEAMAAGLPAVSTDVSGIPELVQDGVNGLLVPQEDPAALAGALARLSADPVLARRLADAGRRTVTDRFDGDVLAARMAGLFAGARA